MFRYDILLTVISYYLVLSAGQELSTAQISNVSANGRVNPSDYDYPESNLWLITNDDPIPVKLNGQWPVERAIPADQLVNLGRSVYGGRLSTIQRSDDSGRLQQSVVAISQDPVVYYDQNIASANRPLAAVGSESAVQGSGAVLVQLPVDITEGLWERPQIQTSSQAQNYPSARQNIPRENINIEYEEVPRDDRRTDLTSVLVPVRELTSRLPNSEIFADSDITVPLQPYQTPVSSSSAFRDSTRSVDRFSTGGSYPETNGRGISFVTIEERLPVSENATTQLVDGTYSSQNFERDDVQEYGHVLTAEDIELLERLGILSSFVVEPVTSGNVSTTSLGRDDFQREYESHPVLIDNGGQSYLVNAGNNNDTNLNDVVLIDIPNFSRAEYHSNIPENVGVHHGTSRISPYVLSESEDEVRPNNAWENIKVENETYVSGREVLEILEFLNLNAGNFFNLSTSVPLTTETTDLRNTENPEKKIENLQSSENIKTTNNTDNKQPAAATLSENVVSYSEQSNNTQNFNPIKASQPSISNGRIQPRLLETQTLKENEILSRLVGNAIPISEKKLDLLKKLQIQPQPYFFGYKQKDENGTFQHRNENSDAKGVVKGTYGYRDATGVYRNVSYIADGNGFHAVVKTNEPGTVSHNTADVVFMAERPPLAALIKMMAYRKPTLLTNATEKP